uniref:Thioredoxin domain-containing protein n=1 Tax=viral metagenome TaxID=1070528 RepID=A0A6C0JHN1_9ZZZZ
MIFLHIDPTSDKKNTKLFNKYLKDGKDIFVLFYLEGCGPCNETKPEWKKIHSVFADNNNNIVVADIDQSVMKNLHDIRVQPKGFPSMYHICKKGAICNDYEDADISKKDRTIDSFVEWIESHIKKRSHENRMRGGKWSLKYKRSINCNHPKGFSQRQHCKYGRTKLHSITQKRKPKRNMKRATTKRRA